MMSPEQLQDLQRRYEARGQEDDDSNVGQPEARVHSNGGAQTCVMPNACEPHDMLKSMTAAHLLQNLCNSF